LQKSQASVGAACHSHSSSKASPVLLACGVPEAVAINALRISVGRETTRKDVDIFIRDVKNAIKTLSLELEY
jgi:selenocysteine lyase